MKKRFSRSSQPLIKGIIRRQLHKSFKMDQMYDNIRIESSRLVLMLVQFLDHNREDIENRYY